jgi:UDP-4-amino-4,6-dideoxy-N-acetyl-beta-L-altrosamine N-acetyltransferase
VVDVANCLLRPVVSADLETILAWRNHPQVCNFMLSRHAISPHEHMNWFERCAADPARRLLLMEEFGMPRGFAQLTNVGTRSAVDWGFYVAPDSPKGTGRRLGRLVLEHAFNNLQAPKICGQALAFNSASIRLHLWLGFTQEGVLREQIEIENVRRDLVCFGILARELAPGGSHGE